MGVNWQEFSDSGLPTRRDNERQSRFGNLPTVGEHSFLYSADFGEPLSKAASIVALSIHATRPNRSKFEVAAQFHTASKRVNFAANTGTERADLGGQ